jgi:hypothetical protein
MEDCIVFAITATKGKNEGCPKWRQPHRSLDVSEMFRDSRIMLGN